MQSEGNVRHLEPLEPRLLELYRRATPTQKLTVVARLNGTLLELKSAALAAQHPALSPGQRRTILRRWWLTATD